MAFLAALALLLGAMAGLLLFFALLLLLFC